jgi:hypothetical protein
MELIDVLNEHFSPVSDRTVESMFDDYIDEVYSNCLCYPFDYLDPSDILKQMIPGDYEEYKSEYIRNNYDEEDGELWHMSDYEEAQRILEEEIEEEEESDPFEQGDEQDFYAERI